MALTAKHGLAATLALALMPGGSAQAADGTPTMLVLNKIKSRANLPGNLVEMDVAHDKILHQIPVGNEPHEVALSPDGKLAIVSNTGSYDGPGHTLSLIDMAQGREIRRVELGAMFIPHGLAWSGGKAYFTSETAKALGRYDPVTDKVDWVLGLGGDGVHMLKVTEDGSTIFASERSSDRIAVARYAKPANPFTPEWQVTHWPVCAGPEGFDLAPGGKELWVGCRGANRIMVLDARTGAVLRQMDTGTQALVRVKFTLDGRHVLASDLKTGNVKIIDPATMSVIKTLSTGSGCEGILIAPDGHHAYVADSADNQVAEIDLDTLTVTRHLHSGLGPDGMAWVAN